MSINRRKLRAWIFAQREAAGWVQPDPVQCALDSGSPFVKKFQDLGYDGPVSRIDWWHSHVFRVDLVTGRWSNALRMSARTRGIWRKVLSEQQNHKCCYCGGEMFWPESKYGHRGKIPQRRYVGVSQAERWNICTLDHVIPLSKGGADHPDNMVVAHNRCNSNRSSRDAFEYYYSLHPDENPDLDNLKEAA